MTSRIPNTFEGSAWKHPGPDEQTEALRILEQLENQIDQALRSSVGHAAEAILMDDHGMPTSEWVLLPQVREVIVSASAEPFKVELSNGTEMAVPAELVGRFLARYEVRNVQADGVRPQIAWESCRRRAERRLEMEATFAAELLETTKGEIK